MSTNYPIKEFRFASQTSNLTTPSSDWSDIDGLILDFDETDSGNFLVTLSVPNSTNTAANSSAHFGVVLRDAVGDQLLGEGYYDTAYPSQAVPFSLVCEAQIAPTSGGSHIVARWQPYNGGTAQINGFCSLSAVGSLAPPKAGITKASFTDTHHWEDPDLFSRGLLLSNFSEILFITGYGPADVGGQQGGQTDNVAFPCDPEGQMTWITGHLDDFFKTIQYADGTGFYSKANIVYFDLVVASAISDAQQQAVLDVLTNWFESEENGGAVSPRPATGILKKVTGLAVAGMMVEIEFILAR